MTNDKYLDVNLQFSCSHFLWLLWFFKKISFSISSFIYAGGCPGISLGKTFNDLLLYAMYLAPISIQHLNVRLNHQVGQNPKKGAF